MIDELHVQNVALIEDATLAPADGLTVLTGETGAGKTALISSIKLLMGERADTGTIREGTDGLCVEGRLYLSGGSPEGTIVSRRLDTNGRGRLEIDGKMSAVRTCAELIGSSVDLCGQHENQQLLRKTDHSDLLDRWIGTPALDLHKQYLFALESAREAKKNLETLRAQAKTAAAKADEMAFALQRIDEVAPSVEEYEELMDRLPKITHAEALAEALRDAHGAVVKDNGAEDLLGGALCSLRNAERYDKSLSAVSERLEAALIEIQDCASELLDYMDALEFNPDELERMQARISAFRGLMRSYGPAMADVVSYREKITALLEMSQKSSETLEQAQQNFQEAEALLWEKAHALDALRRKHAPVFARSVTKNMEKLQLGSASLELVLKELPRAKWAASGSAQVEFLYRPAAGMTAHPLRSIASGGEISRVMLAIKAVLGKADQTDTLIFDEVDAGCGGAAAIALAELLSDLSQTHQLIVVTHLAQIAVMADKHYLVSKSDGDFPSTTLTELSGKAQTDEIARMLSGAKTELARAHAQEMLAAAAKYKAHTKKI